MDPASNPLLQYGALGLCALGLAVLWYVIRSLLRIVGNHLTHIEKTLKGLPCQPDTECPAQRIE